MNRKPYNNKSNYDPGRFRALIVFKQQLGTDDGSGGSDITYPEVYTCKAIELPVRDAAQLEIEAGASTMNEDRWFVIRYTSAFEPMKDMNIIHNSNPYVIRAIVPVDQPLKYYKLLAIRQNG